MSKTCTCPSGDGSLRHPCPSHPPICAEIKPDTSLYTDMPSRLRATALVSEAHTAGKETQYSGRGKGDIWHPMTFSNHYNVNDYDYRIRPEPREWWLNVYPSGYAFAYKEERDARSNLGTGALTIKVREVTE